MRRSSNRDTGLFVQRTGAGPAVLFLHGFPLDHDMWREAIGSLSGVADCIAPDLRGFGQSGAPPTATLTMDQHADDAAALLDSLGVHAAHVVGLSMGGYAALAFAERHAARLASLVLVDTRSADDGDEGRARRSAAADRVLEVGRAVFAREMLTKLVAPSAGRDVRARLLTTMEATPYETIVAALLGMQARPDRTHVLRALTRPLLIVCGALDAITPPDDSRAMAAANPESELALIPDAGHMSPMERPREFAAILADFLGRQG
jgi:pimeloyl-ACP methyl ester carboxylesterase